MKRVFAAILLLVYFTVTTGFTVSVHYCMNKLDSVELGYSGKTECDKCGMTVKKSDGCCKDEVKVVKLHTDHQAAKFAVPDFSFAHISSPAFPVQDITVADVPETAFAPANGPPLPQQDLYLRNCVFRL